MALTFFRADLLRRFHVEETKANHAQRQHGHRHPVTMTTLPSRSFNPVWSVGFGSAPIHLLLGAVRPLGGIVELAPRYLKYKLELPLLVRKDVRRGELKMAKKRKVKMRVNADAPRSENRRIRSISPTRLEQENGRIPFGNVQTTLFSRNPPISSLRM